MNHKFKLILFTNLLVFLATMEAMSQNVALNFDGTDDYIETSYKGISGSSARTVEAWIRTSANANPNNGGIQQVITDWGSSATGQRFTMNVLWSDALRLEIQGEGLSGKTPINDGNWHHVAAVYNPNASLKYRLFVDGVLDTAANLSTGINTGTNTNLLIGRRIDGMRYFDGDIDEVKVYNYARTDSAIAADLDTILCSTQSGLVAYYHLDEGIPNSNNFSRATAVDYSGNAKHGALNNFTLSGSGSNWISGKSLIGGNSADTIDVFECISYTGPRGNATYSTSGTYIEDIPNSYGCDSIITINLTIGISYAYVLPQACDSFISPSGKIIKNSGIYRDTFYEANSVGCDSVYIMNISLNKSVNTFDTIETCDSLYYLNKWWNKSQKIHDTLKSSTNCDSIHTTQLVVFSSNLVVQIDTNCDNYVLPSGKKVTVSGVYYDTLIGANLHGCDSIIRTDLHLNYTKFSEFDTTVCDSFISFSGAKYFNSGDKIEGFTTANGCDSSIIYHLIVNESRDTSIAILACDSAFIGNKWHNKSGQILVNETTSMGCNFQKNYDLSIVSTDTSVTKSGNILASNDDFASYQWISCDTKLPISGATNQTFTTDINGFYQVILFKQSCTDTSACYSVNHVGIDQPNMEEITLYPNPNLGSFGYSAPDNVKLKDLYITDKIGKRVYQNLAANIANTGVIEVNLPAGIYYLHITTKKAVYLQKVVITN